MPGSPDTCNQVLEEFRTYLETLTFIQVDPRLRSEFSMSDIIQNTLLEAWQDLERIELLDANGRGRWLRKMLVNNLIEEVRRVGAKKRDFRRKQSLEAAVEESSCRLHEWLQAEETPMLERLVRQEEQLRLLEALSKLDVRQREALILQQFHGWTYEQIAEHLGCTLGAVAGLHAHGLRKLHKYLADLGGSDA
jgi:RNA polymerase sigma-70 factor (ECF subfamily)